MNPSESTVAHHPWRQALLAGSTNFFMIAYIVFVQPQMFTLVGLPAGAVATAVCVVAALCCLAIGLWAKAPLIVAPGMGGTFFCVYTLGQSGGYDGATIMTLVCATGLIMLLLTVIGLRERILQAIPQSLQFAIVSGIGIFIAYVGLQEAGVIVRDGSQVYFGQFNHPAVILAIFGFVLSAWMVVREVRAGLLLGIIITTAVGWGLGIIQYQGIMALPPAVYPLWAHVDWNILTDSSLWGALGALVLMVVLDTGGSFMGITAHMELPDAQRRKILHRSLYIDSIGSTLAGFLGAPPVVYCVESVAGYRSGGRTGRTAVVTGICFIIALFFTPLIAMVGAGITGPNGQMLHPVVAPALVLVGTMMMSSVSKIPWDDFAEAIPAFLMLVAIPVTGSIADGMAAGFIAYPVVQACAGRARRVPILLYVLAGLLIFRYIAL